MNQLINILIIFACIKLNNGALYQDGQLGNMTDNEQYLLDKLDQMQKYISANFTKLNSQVQTIKDTADKMNSTGICGEKWFAFKDQKCYRVLDGLRTESDSEKECKEIDSNPIIIETQEEQDYLSHVLSDYSSVSDNVWIGLKFTNNKYKWVDGSDPVYTNWATDAVKDGSNACVEMSLGKASLGKWRDDSCNRKCITVCQKLPSTVAVMKDELVSMTKIIDMHELKLRSLTDISIPIGFIYVQLPNQTEPIKLWPKGKWSDVTSQYAGLFFRAFGGTAATFGKVQPANSSYISNVRTISLVQVAHTTTKGYNDFQLKEGEWSADVVDNQGSNCALNYMQFYSTSGENRPRNTAIKIWKKTA